MPAVSPESRWAKVPGGTFARGVVTLASGTAIAQLLLVVAVPLLTRLYTPADYGVLAVYASTITVLVVVASLRYEVAIPLPEDDLVAGSLLALTFIFLAVTAGIIGVLIWLLGDAFVATMKVPALGPYRWLILVGFVGAGTYQALTYWAIRRRAFARLARTRLTQGAGQVVTQIALGLARTGSPGLLVGDVVGRVVGGGGLAVLAMQDRPMAQVTRTSLLDAAVRYRRFPLLTTWAGLFNIGSLQLPSIVFAASFGAAAAGLYALSFKALVLPTMLVSQAVSQVFLSRAAAVAREPERLRQLTERTALVLFGAGLPVFAAVGLGGPRIFGAVMGSQWEAAGRYAQVLAPWFVVWCVSNPLSGLLSVREWQASALAFSAVEFALRLGALLVGAHRGSPMLAVVLLSASGVVISLASIARFMRAGHSSIGRLVDPIARLVALAAACLLPGVLLLHAGSGVLGLIAGAAGMAAYYVVVLRSDAASGLMQRSVETREVGAMP
jgi:lipopolysaccharide exporter